jgi:hypothetical protein
MPPPPLVDLDGEVQPWNLLPNGSVGIATEQRLFLHRFPASEGLPGFWSWRAIARRICLVHGEPLQAPDDLRLLGLELPDDLSLRRRSSGKQCSAQSTPPRHGQGAHRQQRGLSLRFQVVLRRPSSPSCSEELHQFARGSPTRRLGAGLADRDLWRAKASALYLMEPSSTRQARPRVSPASLSSDRALLEILARVGVQQSLCARPRRELGCEGVHPRHQH